MKLQYLYGQVYTQFRRYLGHVSTNVGGVYQYYKTSDQRGAVYLMLKKSSKKLYQIPQQELVETPTWMIDKNILDKIQVLQVLWIKLEDFK